MGKIEKNNSRILCNMDKIACESFKTIASKSAHVRNFYLLLLRRKMTKSSKPMVWAQIDETAQHFNTCPSEPFEMSV